MKILNLAIFLGLLAMVGCDENAMDDDIPETMPGQVDSDVGPTIENPNEDLDPNGAMGVDDGTDMNTATPYDPNMVQPTDPATDPGLNQPTPGTEPVPPTIPPVDDDSSEKAPNATGTDTPATGDQPAGEDDTVEEVDPGNN